MKSSIFDVVCIFDVILIFMSSFLDLVFIFNVIIILFCVYYIFISSTFLCCIYLASLFLEAGLKASLYSDSYYIYFIIYHIQNNVSVCLCVTNFQSYPYLSCFKSEFEAEECKLCLLITPKTSACPAFLLSQEFQFGFFCRKK